MKKYAVFALLTIAALVLCAFGGCSCDSLKLKDDGFDFKENTASATDNAAPASDSDAAAPVYSDEYADFVVPENAAVEYPEWRECDNAHFKALANEKLGELAEMVSSLISMKGELAQCHTPEQILENQSFLRSVNNIRAWRHGCESFASDKLDGTNKVIHGSLSLLGVDACECAASLPALILSGKVDSAADFENLIIGEIVALSEQIDK